MSDYCISIVPKISSFPNKEEKIDEILSWLIENDIIKPDTSDCILGSRRKRYAVSIGAKHVTTFPEYLPFDLEINGLEIIDSRQVFDTGGNGIESVMCPACCRNILANGLDFIAKWYEGENAVQCSICETLVDIHSYDFTPEWGFSDLGFSFWNWPKLTDSFMEEFQHKLGCEINLVFTRI